MARKNLERNAAYTQEYLNCIGELNGDEDGRRAAWDAMGQGTAFYKGLPVAFSYVPRFFGEETRAYLAQAARTAYGILAKVIKRYQEDPVYRRKFRLDPRVEELVLLPSGYDEPLPLTRVDFIFNEETADLHFCEFNTDSSSGMNESREAICAVTETEPFQRFAAQHRVSHDVSTQTEGWVQTFKRIYESTGRAVEHPHVGIVACLDSPNPHIGELETYMHAFEDAGFTASVFDVRQLDFDGERLIGRTALAGPSNVAIDCVWRFCIVVDLLEHWGEVQPFVNALRAEAAVMIGSFATQIAHDKQIFAVLRRSETQAMLTPDERAFVDRCIPRTMFLDDPALDLEAVKAHPERWVLKPTDWYASINVTVGAECSPDEWARRLDECLAQEGGSPYILQEFFKPCATPAIPLYGQEADFVAEPQMFGNLLGAYVYAGEFAGLYVRQGPHDVIGSARAGLVTPVFWVEE